MMGTSGGTGHITTLTAKAEEQLYSFSDRGAFHVWVLGGDAELRLKLADLIPAAGTLGQLGTRLDDAADRIEQALLDLDTQLLAGEEDRLAWSVSLIGDRSPYAGDLQLNAARYLVMHEIVQGGGRHLFFVEDDLTAWALCRAALVNGLDVGRDGSAIKRPPMIETLRARASAVKTHIRQARTLKALRVTKPAPWAALRECDVIVIDWAGKGSFDSTKPTERVGNMARMPGVLRDAGLKVGFIANPLSWTQAFSAIAENMVAAFDPVVMVDECRGLGSVVRGAWATWRMNRRLKTKLRLGGLNVAPLVELEREKDKIRPQPTMAYTYSDIAMTLAHHGIHPKAIVYPFENQGWERALLAGARRHLPDTRMIAYQHAPFAARYIGFYPSQSDIDLGYLPHQLVVMGERFTDLFLHHGWPTDQLVLGGSLRFEQAAANPAQHGTGPRKNVLAATSIDLSEAMDLVSKAAAVVKDNPDQNLLVNFHPVVDEEFRERVRVALEMVIGADRMDQVELSDERATALIGRADVLLYNSSGAVFDAFFAGVPSIHVAVDGQLSFDKVPGDTALRVTNHKELQSVMNQVLASSKAAQPDMSIGGCIASLDEAALVDAVMGI